MSSNILISRIESLAETEGSGKAVCFRRESLTFAELLQKMKRVAGALREMDIQPGACVLYSSVTKPMGIAFYLGILYAGCTAVHIDKNSTPENAFAIYDAAGAAAFLTDMRMDHYPDGYRVASMKEIWENEQGLSLENAVETDPETVAEMIFTSGTTGSPKGVMLSTRAVNSIIRHTKEGLGIRGDDIVLIPLPLHHSLGLRVLRASLYSGAAVVLQNGFAFAGEIEKNLDNWHCTGLASVPASMELMRGQMKDRFYEVMSRFRFIEVGAGALTPEQRKRLTAHLPDTELNNTWGSSETGGALFTKVHEAVKSADTLTTIGKPLPDIEVRILDTDGQPMETTDREHPGRLALKGGMIMSGYCGRPDLTADALRDGWLVTGDMVYADDSGYVYMLGRTDDLINVGGEKVSPLEIENAASEFPGMKECACIGVADDTLGLGQVPVLFVVTEGEFNGQELMSFLSGHIERIKLPQKMIPLEAVPRNKMQKIDRKALRALWEKQYS